MASSSGTTTEEESSQEEESSNDVASTVSNLGRSASTSDSSTGILIGAVVGGLALVGAVIGGVWFMKRRAKQNRRQDVTVTGVAVQMTTSPAAETHPTK